MGKEKYSQFPCFSKHASRQNPEPIELGLPFEIDRNKIINSKAFRRLKTQNSSFLNPKGDHYRSSSHIPLEVANISRLLLVILI